MLTIPVLVYLFKIDPFTATSYSLFIVGITALYGSWRHYKLGNLQLKASIVFAIPSLLSLLFTRAVLVPMIPIRLFNIAGISVTRNMLIMLVFALLMIFVSVIMIRKTKTKKIPSITNNYRLAMMGFLVGFFTGFLGAGGGFVIIPTLIFFAGLEMKQAVGTSLLIIAINSLIGFAGDLIQGIQLNYILLLSISALAIAGMFIGTLLSQRINGNKLRPAFGWFVLLMGAWIIIKEFLL